MATTMVIIGTGRAGVQAAMTLRKESSTCRIILISEDKDLPYDKVPLSKHYLYGKPGFHSLYFNDTDYYEAHNIELWLDSPVVAIDTENHQIQLSSGKRQAYDKLLLATGLSVNHWKGQGAELKGVHYLRTLADARNIYDTLSHLSKKDASVVVIGTGWIGCEVAAAAYEHGVKVNLIGRHSLPLLKQVGPEIGEFYYRAHFEHGVQLHLNSNVKALLGTDSVEAVELTDGTKIPADIVIFGIGAHPRAGLAENAGIELATTEQGGGILTDEYLQTTIKDIYAAGDIANVPNAALGKRIRSEHHKNAVKQGKAAAMSMLGKGKPYSQIPFFFSDQFDIWMETTGDLSHTDDFVMRKYPGKDKFIAFWLRDGKLSAGMNINIKEVPPIIEELIKSGKLVNREKLADYKVPLMDVLQS